MIFLIAKVSLRNPLQSQIRVVIVNDLTFFL